MAATIIDPYVSLGIPAGASRETAARAHRRLAKQFHPDVNPGPASAERMRRINEAWRILSNPARRVAHDAAPGHTTTMWTTWPESRVSSALRYRRPARPEPVEPSLGDRPAVVISVGLVLMLLYVVGAWLGSIGP